MKCKFSDMSIYKQFSVAFVIIVLIPIMSVTGISYVYSTKHMMKVVEDLAFQLNANINTQFDNMLNDINWLSLQLAHKPEVKEFMDTDYDDSWSKYNFNKLMRNDILIDSIMAKTPVISSVDIIGDNGNTYSAGIGENLDNYQYLLEDRKVEKRNDIYKSSLPAEGSMAMLLLIPEKELKTAEKGTGILSFGRRVFTKNSMIPTGTVAINIYTNSLVKLWMNKDIMGGIIWIADNKGQIIYHPDNNKVGKNTKDEGISIDGLTAKVGSFEKVWDQKQYFFAYNKSGLTGLTIFISIPSSNLKAPVRNLHNIIWVSISGVFLFAAFAGYYIIRSITKPVFKLQKAMKGLSDDNWKTIDEPLPNNEIGSLIKVYNKMITKISDLIETLYKDQIEKQKSDLKNKKAELAKKAAEFQALQMQINPHFLYNTLTIINAHALEVNDVYTQKMINALSKMLRYSVQNAFETVSLQDELEHVNNFLTIQQYRVTKMPVVNIDVGEYSDRLLLRLTLQPLIENVFKYAFPYIGREENRIDIRAYVKDVFFIIEVSDNGIGIKKDIVDKIFGKGLDEPNTGIGLNNVHKRIQIAYGRKYGLEIRSNPNSGTSVLAKLPAKSSEFGIRGFAQS